MTRQQKRAFLFRQRKVISRMPTTTVTVIALRAIERVLRGRRNHQAPKK